MVCEFKWLMFPPGEDCRAWDEDSLCSDDSLTEPMRGALLSLMLSRFADMISI